MEKEFLKQSIITDKRIINKIFNVKLIDYLDMSFLIVDKNFEEKVVKYFLDSTDEVERVQTLYWKSSEDLKNIFKDNFDLKNKVGIENICPYILTNALEDLKVNLQSITKDLNYCLSIKSDEEIKKIKTLSAVNQAVIFNATNNYTTTINELEAAHIIRTNFEDYNIYNLPIDPSISFGENLRAKVHRNSETYLKEEIPISVDVFCEKDDINATLARTYYYGNNDYTDLNDMYKRLFDFHVKTVELMKPGVSVKEIYVEATNIAKKLNIEKYMPKYFGYGVGTRHIERPLISNDDDAVLKENMVLAVDSRINRIKYYSCKVKDMILIKKDGGEFLSNTQPEIKRIYIEGR